MRRFHPVVRYLVCALISAAMILPAGAQTRTPYDIPVILSLAGPAAALGHAAQVALQAEERMINATGGIHGRPVHFAIVDDHSDPATSVQLATRIFAGSPPIVIGPAFGQTCAAVSALVKQNGPVLFCLSNVPEPPPRGYQFDANATNDVFTLAGMRYLRARGITKIALLDSTDVTGNLGEEAALKAVKLPQLAGLQVVDDERFNLSDLSVSAQIARLKASGAQAIWIWTIGIGFGIALHGIADAGVDLPILTMGGNINTAQVEQYASFFPKDIAFSGPPYFAHDDNSLVLRARAAFVAAMRSVDVDVPDQASIVAWDPALIAVDALRHVGTNASARALRDYLLGLHGFPGINGTYDFRNGDQRGLGPDAAVVSRWNPTTKTWYAVSKRGGLPL